MPDPPDLPTLSQVSRQQYRETSSSPVPRAFRIITPVTLLAAALLGVLLHSPIVPIILGALAVAALVGSILWSRKRQSPGPGQT